MPYQYNHGLVTPMKGAAIQAARIVDLDSATCTIAEQSAAGFLSSVTIAAGLITVTVNGPRPPRLVACIPTYSTSATTDDIITARYVEDSWDADAGTFQIALSDDDDAGAPIAGAPASPTEELHLVMVFCRYTVL